ncbi:hypothetical protein KGM_211386 [Danaus plexippus plexippus]|uniref:Uncharacterized protein n=1 Tax=Danaus plexippus plexippus TaxID=278856 RepID=A0A212F5R5_DANPL|nr:hypothetical protein KGM_211386 [Danaus plexippus plexippus]
MYWIFLAVIIQIHCWKGFEDSFKYEKLHMFGLGRPLVNLRSDNAYAYPEDLVTKKQTYIRSPYRSIYQGVRSKRDHRVYNKKFGYPPRLRGHHIFFEGVFECVLTHVSIETNASIPSILRGGVGYRHFSIAIRAGPGEELSGRVRAFCSQNSTTPSPV